MHFNFKRIFGLVIFLSLVFPLFTAGQEKAVRKAERKKELVKKLERKYHHKKRKKTLRHRREIQSENTRKQMQEAEKRARKFNRSNDKGWIEEHFRRKGKKP